MDFKVELMKLVSRLGVGVRGKDKRQEGPKSPGKLRLETGSLDVALDVASADTAPTPRPA